MGGDWPRFLGCVPSKALIAAAASAAQAQPQRRRAFGIAAVEPAVDFGKVMDHVAGVIAAIAPNDPVERFEKLGVRVLQEEARFIGRTELQAGSHRIRSKRIVLATGSRAHAAAGAGPCGDAALHQRDDLRQPHAALASRGAGRRTDRPRDGAGLPATRLEGHRAGGGEPAWPRTTPNLPPSCSRVCATKASSCTRETRVRQVERHGRRNCRRPRRRRADRRFAPAGRDGPHAHGRRARSRQGGRRPRPGTASRSTIRCAPPTAMSGRSATATDVYAFTHMAGHEASLFIRGAPVPRAGEARPRHRALGDLHRSRTGAGRPQRARCARPARRRHKSPRGGNSPRTIARRPSAKPTGSLKVVTDRRGRILGAGIAGPAGRRTDPDAGVWPFPAASKISTLASFVPPYPTLGENRQAARPAAIMPRRCSVPARGASCGFSPDCRSGRVGPMTADATLRRSNPPAPRAGETPPSACRGGSRASWSIAVMTAEVADLPALDRALPPGLSRTADRERHAGGARASTPRPTTW